MTLIRLDRFYPNYREDLFDGEDIRGLPIYAGQSDEKIGTIENVLVDEEGRFRYFVIDTGFWIFGKKLLLPVGQCRIDEVAERIYATGLRTKQQAEQLPEYHDGLQVDDHYEERVSQVYRAPIQPLEASLPLESPVAVDPVEPTARSRSDRYQQDPSLYGMQDQTHRRFKLYEERLVATKHRQKTGEVTIGKHVETKTARTSVPVQRERVVIERIPSARSEAVAVPQDSDFREGQVARIEVYEETPDIRKEAFVREEVQVHKAIEHKTVNAEETIRREELDIDTSSQFSR